MQGAEQPAAAAGTGGSAIDGLRAFTVEQVMGRLQMSRAAVLARIADGRLEAIRDGGRLIRISEWALRAYLTNTSAPSTADTADGAERTTQ